MYHLSYQEWTLFFSLFGMYAVSSAASWFSRTFPDRLKVNTALEVAVVVLLVASVGAGLAAVFDCFANATSPKFKGYMFLAFMYVTFTWAYVMFFVLIPYRSRLERHGEEAD
ncbi:hypothetical protein [Gloeobacter morelensis]|uniref:hypothetical protein n=1 Tax=Gloeobacter morelensis TaxID=2907343 RepID=UPI001E64C3D1|nr:hypothetical protein [Gloeobacter morelensis]UFP97196.1 hypothetical protein ISF26_24045 [Gloeobacter morelensis MG652769]